MPITPGTTFSIAFPDLPRPLASLYAGTGDTAQITARLPDDYAPDRQFPLFLYLIGGPGGYGTTLEPGVSVIGTRGFICVSMPLFKHALDRGESDDGLMISMADFDLISRCYRTMLTRFFDDVPNVTRMRSTIGGFSNGAHTTGVLLAGQDAFILEHFDSFYLFEGGIGPLFANVLQKKSFRSARFLVMTGSRYRWMPDPDVPSPYHRQEQILKDMTAHDRLDFTYVPMHGYGHEQPQEYLRLIGQWARGEQMDDVRIKA